MMVMKMNSMILVMNVRCDDTDDEEDEMCPGAAPRIQYLTFGEGGGV